MNLLVLKLEYFRQNGPVSRLPIHWLLPAPEHQQPWYWLCRINASMSSTRKDFNYLSHLSVGKWYKKLIYFHVLFFKFSTRRFIINLQQQRRQIQSIGLAEGHKIARVAPVAPFPMKIGNKTLRPRQNGCHFADSISKLIFLHRNVSIFIQIILYFDSQGLICNNKSALVQVMAWCWIGNKPLSELTMTQINGLVQERRNFSAFAMELHLSCTNPSIYASPGLS